MQDYKEFIEKFQPKRTTDDCYTPQNVYDAVLNWVLNEYGLDARKVVRPFYPGGDFKRYEYPEGCTVIDNPPFSILAKIKKFYIEKRIKFFLFAPHLTLFSTVLDGISYIITNCTITYENGASVNTDFVTNMDSTFIRTAPSLRVAVKKEIEAFKKKQTVKRPIYTYPDTVISSARLGNVADVDFRLNRAEFSYTRRLDAQKELKKGIFGSGFLISEHKAAELRTAELRTAELRKKKETIVFELSNREQTIIHELGKR